jgi:hypothetical protein
MLHVSLPLFLPLLMRTHGLVFPPLILSQRFSPESASLSCLAPFLRALSPAPSHILRTWWHAGPAAWRDGFRRRVARRIAAAQGGYRQPLLRVHGRQRLLLPRRHSVMPIRGEFLFRNRQSAYSSARARVRDLAPSGIYSVRCGAQ